jgi:hypothetical protein
VCLPNPGASPIPPFFLAQILIPTPKPNTHTPHPPKTSPLHPLIIMEKAFEALYLRPKNRRLSRKSLTAYQ